MKVREEFNMKLGAIFKRLRQDRFVSQESLRIHSKIRNNELISDIERGLRCPGLLKMWKLCNGLGIKPSQFAEMLEKEFDTRITSYFIKEKHTILFKKQNVHTKPEK